MNVGCAHDRLYLSVDVRLLEVKATVKEVCEIHSLFRQATPGSDDFPGVMFERTFKALLTAQLTLTRHRINGMRKLLPSRKYQVNCAWEGILQGREP